MSVGGSVMNCPDTVLARAAAARRSGVRPFPCPARRPRKSERRHGRTPATPPESTSRPGRIEHSWRAPALLYHRPAARGRISPRCCVDCAFNHRGHRAHRVQDQRVCLVVVNQPPSTLEDTESKTKGLFLLSVISVTSVVNRPPSTPSTLNRKLKALSLLGDLGDLGSVLPSVADLRHCFRHDLVIGFRQLRQPGRVSNMIATSNGTRRQPVAVVLAGVAVLLLCLRRPVTRGAAGRRDRRRGHRPERRHSAGRDGDGHESRLAAAVGDDRHRRAGRVPPDAAADRDLRGGVHALGLSVGAARGHHPDGLVRGEDRHAVEAGGDRGDGHRVRAPRRSSTSCRPPPPPG